MNKSLVQLGRQLLAIWNQLGLNQRVLVVATTLGVLAGLAGVAFWSSRVDYRLLYGKLDDADAAKVVATLADSKVPHRIGADGSSIYVPANQVHPMRMQLASRGIRKSNGVGFEIFDRPNFGVSDFVQRANYVRALQGELSRTISELDDVESAQVLLVIPENRLLLDQKKQPTASVFIKTRGSAAMPASAVNAIRILVANSVEGLSPNHVSVVDNRGTALSDDTEPDSIAGLTASQLAARRNLEQYLARKAEGMLQEVLGPGQAVVRVAAEINLDSVTTTKESYDPEAKVERSVTLTDEKTDTITGSTTSATGGAGAATPAATNAAPTTASTTKNAKKNTTTEYEVGKTVSNLVQGAGGVRRISAAVFVAPRIQGAGPERKVVLRTPEELEKLKRIVQTALGIQSPPNSRQDEIVLEQMEFNNQLGTELTQQLDRQQTRQFYWNVGSNLLYPLLGFAVLGLFWRTLKRTPVETIPIGIPIGELSLNGNGHSGSNGNGNGNGHNGFEWDRRNQPGVVTVDVLNQLIKENPANMTQAIRSWMGGERKK